MEDVRAIGREIESGGLAAVARARLRHAASPPSSERLSPIVDDDEDEPDDDVVEVNTVAGTAMRVLYCCLRWVIGWIFPRFF